MNHSWLDFIVLGIFWGPVVALVLRIVWDILRGK